MKKTYSMKDIMEQFKLIYEALDCSDNSCLFKKKNKFGKYGMRTNGGCRCLRNTSLLPKQERTIRKLLQMLKYNLDHEIE